MSRRKVILYIATSLDGYIAAPGGDLNFLGMVAKEGEDYGYAEFVKTVDTVIMGRKTYDSVLAMGYDYPHADKESYIITRTVRPSIGNIRFYTGTLKELVLQLKAGPGKNIYCDGGAEVVNMLEQDDLIDEYIISVIPVMLGGGTRLFANGRSEMALELISSRSYPSGLVQLHYSKHRK